MTEDHLTIFEDKAVRIIEQDGDVWIPLVDLATAWGIDRKTPANLIDRNQEIFEGMVLFVGDVTSQERVINERGLYLLMGKISADRLKNKDARAAMIRFQRWVPELIQKYRKKEIVRVPPPDTITSELHKAREYATLCEKSPEAFQAAVFRKHGMPEFADALQVPAIIHGETGWFNVSQLVTKCNDPLLNAERLNHYLKNQGFQYRDGYIWRLTPLGMEHGKEYWYTAPSQHQEIRIAWRESVLFASGLKRTLADDQTALASTHG